MPVNKQHDVINSRQCAAHLVRYEASDGFGFFSAANDFRDLATNRPRFLRSRTKLEREIESLYTWLRNHTNPVDVSAYKGDRSKYPCTWFKSTAVEHIRHADRLCAILNREGMNIRRLERPMPIRPLWEDDVQVVTRRPRGATFDPFDTPPFASLFERRVAARRSKQAKRRVRAGRAKARRLKSIMD